MNSHLRSRIAAALLLAGAVACSSSGSAASGARPSTSSDRNTLRTAELTEAQKDLTVLQVIRQIRPQFLSGTPTVATSGRGQSMQSGSGGLIVYVDDSRLGGVSTLSEIRMREIVELRYLPPTEASGRYGLGHDGGVIAIRRKR